MNIQAIALTEVTIVVVPRERFSYTQQSLESIYQHTEYPFKLIYIDAGSPPHIRDYLATQAVEKEFQFPSHRLLPFPKPRKKHRLASS